MTVVKCYVCGARHPDRRDPDHGVVGAIAFPIIREQYFLAFE
jgi:hypothetical protein